MINSIINTIQKKSTEKISGIYKIINKTNGKYYIGSSDNIHGTSGRWKEHINALKANRHDNDYLQNAWNKDGESNFEIVVIEEVPKLELLIVEQKYLDSSKNEFHNQCYNLNPYATGGGFVGHQHSDESKKKISKKLKGRIFTDEHKKNLSESLIGRCAGFIGKKHSDKWVTNHTNNMKEMWKQKRKENPDFNKGKNHVQYISIKLEHVNELKEFYLSNGSMELYKKGKLMGYGPGVITRLIKEIKTNPL